MSGRTDSHSTPLLAAPARARRWMLIGDHGLAPEIPRVRGPAACLRRDALFRRLLLGADTLALALAFTLSALIGPGSATLSRAGVVAAPVLVVSAKLAGLYDRDPALLRKTTLEESPALAQLASICTLIAWLASETLSSQRPGPGAVATLWLALAIGLIALRSAARALALRISAPERCMVIGDERAAETIRAKLSGGGGVNATLVAHVDLDKLDPWSAEGLSEPRLSEIGRLARTLDVHRAIIAPRSAEATETLNVLRTLKAVGVRVSVLPRLLEVLGSSVQFDDLHGLTVMGVSRFELSRSSKALKRAFDLASASVLLALLSPAIALIALAIRLDSRGPVLFRQLRMGRQGRPFRIYKFRTMVADAEAQKDALRGRNEAQDGLFKIREDPRITRVGRLLRTTALDEIPQLLNVARGEMSLVGPRPLVLEEDSRVHGWQRRRLELTPGVTGPWQILGPARVALAEMAAIDYLYLANWSLWTDIKVLLRTVTHVLGRRGL